MVRTGGRKSLREGGSTPASPTQKLGQFSGSRAGPLTPVSVLQGDGGHKQAVILGMPPKLGLDLPHVSWKGRGSRMAKPVSASHTGQPCCRMSSWVPCLSSCPLPCEPGGFDLQSIWSFFVFVSAGAEVGRERAMISLTNSKVLGERDSGILGSY